MEDVRQEVVALDKDNAHWRPFSIVNVSHYLASMLHFTTPLDTTKTMYKQSQPPNTLRIQVHMDLILRITRQSQQQFCPIISRLNMWTCWVIRVNICRIMKTKLRLVMNWLIMLIRFLHMVTTRLASATWTLTYITSTNKETWSIIYNLESSKVVSWVIIIILLMHITELHLEINIIQIQYCLHNYQKTPLNLLLLLKRTLVYQQELLLALLLVPLLRTYSSSWSLLFVLIQWVDQERLPLLNIHSILHIIWIPIKVISVMLKNEG